MNNFYLIYGNDYSLIKRQIDKLTIGVKDIVKYDLTVSKIDELLDDACTISFFEDKKVIIGENTLFLTTTQDNINHDLQYLTNYINDSNNSNVVILTVLTDKLDERKKIVKLIKEKAKVIYVSPIDEKNLSNFVIDEFKSNGYTIDYKTAEYFVDFVGKNVDILISEINKMLLYKEEDKNIRIKDINDISSRALNDNLLDLCDAIMKKDFKRIFEIYDDLEFLKTEPVKIISIISSQFFLVYQCKLLQSNNLSQNSIANLLNVHPYRVKLALQTDYMLYELKDILKKLHKLDYEIKSSKVDKNNSLELFFINL